MKIEVYTANCGEYDAPRDDIRCYTERDYSAFSDHRRNSRIFKILPHLWLPINTDWSIWVDANIHLKVSPKALVARAQEALDIWCVFKHPGRDTVLEEIRACKKLQKDDLFALESTRSYMEALGAETLPLAMCGVQVRRHTEAVFEICERWWANYCRLSARDQLTLPLSARTNNGRMVHHWPRINIHNNEWFEIRPHRKR